MPANAAFAGAVIGFAGWSGAGKTTLLEKLIPELVRRGIRVAVVKHAHHAFDVDQPGKDSHRHRMAGAAEVLVASRLRWALMHELRDEPEPALDELLAHLSPCDLVLVEGFKQSSLPKIEVHRPANGKPLLYPDDPHVVAVATDAPVTAPSGAAVAAAGDAARDASGNTPATSRELRWLDLNDVGAIADHVLQLARRPVMATKDCGDEGPTR